MNNVIERLVDLEKKSADYGFTWPNVEMILAQAQSECQEIQEAINQKEGQDRVQEEIGDLLHAAFSLCVFMGFDAEATLMKTTNKFEKRLLALLKVAGEQGYTDLKNQSTQTLMHLWELAKQQDNC